MASPESKIAIEVRELFHMGIPLDEALNVVKKEYVLSALEESRNNQSHAARRLGVHRNTFARYIEECKITIP